MSGKLYVVGTPIGNLGDISPRALDTLRGCDFIAAEDTRVTMKILNRFEIKKQLVSYYEHNRRQRGDEIMARLLAGETCALVTDAGMPAVSDPGEELVRLCHEHSVPVESVPGPCAFVTALAISGMPAGRFTFEGFLSTNKPGRREHLEELRTERRTMIFYEAPHKLAATLRDMSEAFGERDIAIVRELTKVHEQVIRTTLQKAAELYGDGSLKGELVLIVAGAKPEEKKEYTLSAAAALARELMQNECLSKGDAAKAAAKQTGIKKGDIYKLLCSDASDVN